MKEIIKRSLTGAILVIVMVIAIISGQLPFMIFFALLIIGALIEFYNISNKMGFAPQKILGIITGLLLFFCIYLTSIGQYKTIIFSLFLFLGILSVSLEIFRKKDNPFVNIALTWTSILYIALPISLLLAIAFRDNIYQYNYHYILSYFIIIWTYDTMAYLGGKTLGKRKLFERISPNKTWEGAIIGLLFALIAAYILSIFYKELTLYQWLITASIISVFGTLGDLAESLLKRTVNLKDSGNILPGHGGLLDRFDALFLAIPAVYLYLHFI
jgi:phosphatidate cytidylyltransferase